MIINTSNPINVMNNSAIIVGKNSSGKSTILNRIKDESKCKPGKDGEIEIDGSPHKVVYISSETALLDTFKGKSAIILKDKQDILTSLNTTITQPSSLFNPAIVNSYNVDLASDLSSKGISSIGGTGVNVNYAHSLKLSDLVDIDTILTYNGVDYSLDDASTGVKAIVALYMLNIRGGLTGDTLMLVDEVDAFLHPEWIQLLSNLIISLIDSDVKILLTTHSPLLVSAIAKKKPELITTVEWGATKASGDLKQVDWNNIFGSVQAELRNKPTHFGGSTGTHTIDDAKKYVRAFLTPETCMMFFWTTPKFVEGYTEKIFLEQTYNEMFIATGGFHLFIIMFRILENFDIHSSFLMDKDFLRGTTTIQPYNEYVFNTISRSATSSIWRISNTFDDYLYSPTTPVKNYEKLPNAIDSIGTTPTDPHGDQSDIEAFINS